VLGSPAHLRAAPHHAAHAESLGFLQDYWNTPNYNDLLEIAMRRLGEAMDGRSTSREALETIAQECEKALRAEGLLKD
jgi:hypothetical protein